MFVNKINVTKTKRPIKRNEKKNNNNQDIKLVHINKKSYIKKNVEKKKKTLDSSTRVTWRTPIDRLTPGQNEGPTIRFVCCCC